MAITAASLRIRFPEFEDTTEYPDARIDIFIVDSVSYMGPEELRWGGRYDVAQANLTAHLLKMADLTAAGDVSVGSGAITSKSAGGVSVSRSPNTKARTDLEDWYMQTAYGRNFLLLRNQSFVGVTVANTPFPYPIIRPIGHLR